MLNFLNISCVCHVITTDNCFGLDCLDWKSRKLNPQDTREAWEKPPKVFLTLTIRYENEMLSRFTSINNAQIGSVT